MAIQDMDICLNVTAEPVVMTRKVSARLGYKICKHAAYVHKYHNNLIYNNSTNM